MIRQLSINGLVKRGLDPLWRFIGHQLSNPHGAAGSLLGGLMAIINDKPNRLAIEALQLEKREVVLEIGFGPGRALAAIAQLVPEGRVLGLDRSSLMVAQANRLNARAIIEGRMELLKGSAGDLPWETASIDKILLTNVVYFFDPEGSEINEIRRALRPGGRVVAYASARRSMEKWPFAQADTHRTFEADDLRSLFRRGGFALALIEIRPVQLPMGIAGLLAIITNPWPEIEQTPTASKISSTDRVIAT